MDSLTSDLSADPAAVAALTAVPEPAPLAMPVQDLSPPALPALLGEAGGWLFRGGRQVQRSGA